MTILSKEAWDTGQAVILPHSLKLEARAEQTLSKASRLSMSDWSTAGAATGGERDEGSGFFPFSFFVASMAMERGENSRWIGGESRGSRRKREQEVRRRQREDHCVQASWPPSQAHNEGAWGSEGAHVQSTATRFPRPQADGARSAPHLPLRFSTKPSPSVPWARGLLSVFWERGSPDLPTCRLRRGSSGGPVRPIFIISNSRPSREAKPRMADDTRLPQEQPRQAGSRRGGEIKARVPRKDPVTQAMTIKARQAPGRHRPA